MHDGVAAASAASLRSQSACKIRTFFASGRKGIVASSLQRPRVASGHAALGVVREVHRLHHALVEEARLLRARRGVPHLDGAVGGGRGRHKTLRIDGRGPHRASMPLKRADPVPRAPARSLATLCGREGVSMAQHGHLVAAAADLDKLKTFRHRSVSSARRRRSCASAKIGAPGGSRHHSAAHHEQSVNCGVRELEVVDLSGVPRANDGDLAHLPQLLESRHGRLCLRLSHAAFSRP
eukprot:scaffold1378_cov257-Pinguiococcus_pyrenoidosus.AAC.16